MRLIEQFCLDEVGVLLQYVFRGWIFAILVSLGEYRCCFEFMIITMIVEKRFFV